MHAIYICVKNLHYAYLIYIYIYVCSNIIWLGDLNYRLTSLCDDTHKFLEKSDWQALLERDQVELNFTSLN